MDGPQDYDRRLETDAVDVRRLFEHATRHPAVVRTLVPFEPPAVRQLPDGQKWIDFFAGIYDVYRQSGIEPAFEEFRERAFAESDRQVMARVPKYDANATYWFEYGLRHYPPVDLDLAARSPMWICGARGGGRRRARRG